MPKLQIKRWMVVAGLSALAVLCGTGCRSLQGNPKELDISIFGIGVEIEFWEPPPQPVGGDIPKLMNRR